MPPGLLICNALHQDLQTPISRQQVNRSLLASLPDGSSYNALCNAQALSKRIHYGKFVAEAKFRSQTAKYAELIERQDAEGIMDALTDRVVELKVGFGVTQRGSGWRGQQPG